MKKVILKTVEFFTGAKVHANHSAIKGQKSGGIRDSNGTDWRGNGQLGTEAGSIR